MPTDGEWLAYLTTVTKKAAHVRIERNVAAVSPPPDIDYLFAPLKHARTDYMVQKATELGARRLRPVMTKPHHCRAGEPRPHEGQCRRGGRTMQSGLCAGGAWSRCPWPRRWPVGTPQRRLIYCDETASVTNPVEALKNITPPAAVLVGPEGGFTNEERAHLKSLPFVTAISLGPRIMRADTVAIAALAVVQATIGDWKR